MAHSTRRNVTSGLALVMLLPMSPAMAATETDLSDLTIEQLSEIDVTTVSKRAESIATAPSSVFVISRDMIARSAALTIPELLRLAPNLHVMQRNARDYVISARGLSGNSTAQNFANKLLVLIDGRSVYTPIFSGVYWDMQDVPFDSIERIEVISGPGATLWGANAVNGVINIITRRPGDVDGSSASATIGNYEKAAALTLAGGTDRLAWRLYGRGIDAREFRDAAGAGAGDGWRRGQAGFRVDWTASSRDTLTIQGDVFVGDLDQLQGAKQGIAGANLLARWTRIAPSGGRTEVQGYFDHVERGASATDLKFSVQTWDVSAQHNLTAGNHELVGGVNARTVRYHIRGRPDFFFVPPRRTTLLVNSFVQDRIALSPRLDLVLGVKLEKNPWIDLEVLPSARLGWSISDRLYAWAAVSRAIRAPTPFDRDVEERVANIIELSGDPDFRPETLIAYEAGARVDFGARGTLSLATFYNVYDRLRNIERIPSPILSLQWGNGLEADSYGVEAWGQYAVAPWWRLDAAVSWYRREARFRNGAATFFGVAQLGNDPEWRASLGSAFDLGGNVTLDGQLRYVGVLPDPRVPAFTELNVRLAWQPVARVTLALAGLNLLRASHREFAEPALPVPRRVEAQVQWRF